MALASGCSATKEPNCTNGALESKLPGNGFPPATVEKGSAKLSGPGGWTVFPNGGAVAGVDMIMRFGKSYDMPNEARIDVLPSPLGSNASPILGANWLYRF